LSEVVLGKAIKQLNLPRDEIVVMTKARTRIHFILYDIKLNAQWAQVYFVVGRKVDTSLGGKNPDECGYVNQHGLSRKVVVLLDFSRFYANLLLAHL